MRHDAEVRLKDILFEIATHFSTKQGLYEVHCQTNEPYVTIGTEIGPEVPQGTVRDGKMHFSYASPEEAVEEFRKAFWRYAEGKTGTLYWRYKAPHAEIDSRQDIGMWKVRCRLIITDQPEVTTEQTGEVIERPVPSGCMAPVPPDSDLMIAWNRYKLGADFENTKKWAAYPAHVDGSLWAAFLAGWQARQ